MPRAKLTLTIPESVWIGDISRTYPDAQFRILAALSNDGSGVGLGEISAPDVQGVLKEFSASDAVTDLDLLHREENTVLVQFETTMPLLLQPIQSAGTPLEMPFTIRDGEVVWEVTAPRERLSALGSQLDEFGIPFTVNEIHERIDSEQLLTNNQLQLIRAAVEQGYYDTPRSCTLTELADNLDLAKSTCSETLHRAEETIIKQFLEEVGDPIPEASADDGPQQDEPRSVAIQGADATSVELGADGTRVLDARQIDGEPFGDIMAALADLPEDETLVLINSFEPRPLYAVLEQRGFAYETTRVSDAEWRVSIESA